MLVLTGAKALGRCIKNISRINTGSSKITTIRVNNPNNIKNPPTKRKIVEYAAAKKVINCNLVFSIEATNISLFPTSITPLTIKNRPKIILNGSIQAG